MLITRNTSKGQVIPLFFGQDAVAASQSNVQLPIPMSEAASVVDGYPMAFGGQILAVSGRTSVAATAGSAAVGATINGTEDDDTTVTITTETSDYVRVPRGSATFAAGDIIGAELTTSGTWDGTTADLAVIVWVLINLEGV